VEFKEGHQYQGWRRWRVWRVIYKGFYYDIALKGFGVYWVSIFNNKPRKYSIPIFEKSFETLEEAKEACEKFPVPDNNK
jgi:hypothetical protein